MACGSRQANADGLWQRRVTSLLTGFGARLTLGRIVPNGVVERLTAVKLDALTRRHAVDFCSHDKIVLVQSFDLLCLQRHGCVAPAEADIRVMAFGLGQISHLFHEGECLGKILELERPLNTAWLVSDIPLGRLTLVGAGLLLR